MKLIKRTWSNVKQAVKLHSNKKSFTVTIGRSGVTVQEDKTEKMSPYQPRPFNIHQQMRGAEAHKRFKKNHDELIAQSQAVIDKYKHL